MKRLLYVIGFLAILIIAIALFPSEIKFSMTTTSPIPFDGISRVITNKEKWTNWWPGEIVNDTTVRFNEEEINIDIILLNGFKANSSSYNIDTQIELQCNPTHNAKTNITLNTVYALSTNPLIKAYQYLTIGKIKKSHLELLSKMTQYFSDVKMVYGFDIKMNRVPNSSYVSVKQDFDHYPNNIELYKMIDEVKAFILSENGKVMNDPILNIVKENSKSYSAMVAVATDKDVLGKGKFMLKQMMLGNIVVGEVVGGPASIEKCRQAVQFYVSDFRKTSPAIAFERMISNRLTTDSTNWITTINYPVFQ